MNQTGSFELEVAALLPRLRRFAHALSRDTADADDLVQASVERALRGKAQWRLGTRLDSWLYTIVRNHWIDTVRARKRREHIERPLHDAERMGEDPSDSLDASIQLKKVMRAMQQLPEEQREVVALILVEGYAYREAAQILDLPMGTVSSRLVRGRTALLALLDGHRLGGAE
jgi:RNA polymerase sigma factor (sigma-70 family)